MEKDKNRSDFQFQVIPDVYTIGLFKRTLSSRKRLRITTAVAILLLWGCFFGVSWFVRNSSNMPGVNTLILIALMAGVLFIGYLVALTIGDTFFSGPWREKMRDPKYVPEDVEQQIALLKNKDITFILTWFASIVLLFFASDFISGGVISWYSNCGGALAMLRSENVESRISALDSISSPLRADAWEDPGIRRRIVQIIETPNEDPEVVALAAYVAGRAQIIEAAEPLILVAKDTTRPEHTRAEAATTIGKLNWKSARGNLITLLNQAVNAPKPQVELATAVMFTLANDMKSDVAVGPVTQILENCLTTACDDEIVKYGFYYLKSNKANQGVSVAFKYIDDPNVPENRQCWAADSLRWTAREKNVPEMKLRFDKTPKDRTCGDTYHKYHAQAPIMMFEHDPLRAIYVRAVGNQMKRSDYDWIWVIGSDMTEDPATRKVAEIYTRAMNEKM